MLLRFPTTVLVFLSILWVKSIYPPASGIADTDFFWHLAYGRWIVDQLALPTSDFFSWTFAGQPYQLTQWLGEAAMGVAFKMGGLGGTKALSVLLTALTIRFAWLGARKYVHNSVAFGLAVMCNLVQIVTPMRPQLFSFALLAICTYLIVCYLKTGQIRHLAIYPVLMALWVNLHGGFIVGLILIGLCATGKTVEVVLEKRRILSIKTLMSLYGLVLASVVAALLNPYGLDALLNVFMIGGLRSSSVISEWMPVNLTTEIGWFYLLNLVPFLALMAISSVKPRVTEGMIAIFFLIFGVLANRQVAMCAAVMAPLTAALLSRTPQYAKMQPTFADPSKPITYLLIVSVLGLSYPVLASKGDHKWETTLNLQYPIKAADFLEQHKLTDRVLSDTLEASYLIYRGIPVFVDGRMDLYRDQFYFEWYLASRAAPGWETVIKKHQPRAMLLRQDMAIRQAALASGGWKQVFEDDRYSVLVPKFSSLPEITPQDVTYLDGKGGMVRPYMP